MTVYHGSYIEIPDPDIGYGRTKLDFGQGFYVTLLIEQAEKWAKRRASLNNTVPIINIYNFDIDGLNILQFDGYTEEWLDFIVLNRTGRPAAHGFDAVYGNLANDDVASIINDYVRLRRRGRMTANAKSFYLEQLQYEKPNNQYCITTAKGINALSFTDSCRAGV